MLKNRGCRSVCVMILFSNKNTVFMSRKKKFGRSSVLRFISCFLHYTIRLIIILWLRGMLTLGEAGGRVDRTLNYFYNYSVSLKLFQNEKFLLNRKGNDSSMYLCATMDLFSVLYKH